MTGNDYKSAGAVGTDEIGGGIGTPDGSGGIVCS